MKSIFFGHIPDEEVRTELSANAETMIKQNLFGAGELRVIATMK